MSFKARIKKLEITKLYIQYEEISPIDEKTRLADFLSTMFPGITGDSFGDMPAHKQGDPVINPIDILNAVLHPVKEVTI